MPRTLDTATLDAAAKYYAGTFMADRMPFDRDWVMREFYNFTFKDEHAYLAKAIKGQLGKDAGKAFETMAETRFEPRDDGVFAGLLADKLAIDPEGNHIPGKIGTTQYGRRVVGKRVNRRGAVKNDYWNIYAGEGEERIADSGVADDLPPGTEPLPLGALNTRISNEAAILMVQQIQVSLDEGAGAAVIEGRTTPRPANVDDAVTGTLLFTLTCTDPSFPAGADATPGGIITASAITDDTSADATGTLLYCRASATTTPPTPIDDHIEGECGTSGADFNFNTLAIVSGATVSMTSWTVTQPEA